MRGELADLDLAVGVEHIIAVGAPDFRIINNKLATGYVECKDIGINLDEVIKTEQLKRYLNPYYARPE